MRDLPAHRRPLPLRAGLPCRIRETARDAIAVFDKAVAASGVPQRLLSDNGIALNPSRRGLVGQLVAHAAALGTEAITGKPYKPTTQGKNERFHQTLFRYLDKQPLADTLAELQAQVHAALEADIRNSVGPARQDEAINAA